MWVPGLSHSLTLDFHPCSDSASWGNHAQPQALLIEPPGRPSPLVSTLPSILTKNTPFLSQVDSMPAHRKQLRVTLLLLIVAPRWEAEREGTDEEAALGFACVSCLSSQTCKTTTELSDSGSLLWRRGEESLTPFACTLGPGKMGS